MEIELLIKEKKDTYQALINYIEATNDSEDEFYTLIEILEKQNVLQNKDEMRLLLRLISKIADNHHRTSDFFNKLEQILLYLIKDKPLPISSIIPDYDKFNERILYLLLEKGLIVLDESEYLQCKHSNKTFSIKDIKKFQLYYYLYPKMKKYISKKIQKQIEEEILKYFGEEISTFEEKCQIGENDLYICSLIREDSVEEFISYITKTNLTLSSKIKPSIYETNKFLIDNEPTLIEYAAFYGAIQIVQFLKYSGVPLTFSLWFYAVHSNNAELIHFLEDNEVKPDKNKKAFSIRNNNSHIKHTLNETFEDVFIESVKCHNSSISIYIKDNLLDQYETYSYDQCFDDFGIYIIDSMNYFFFPNNIESIICKSGNNNGFKLSNLCSHVTTLTIPSFINSIRPYAFAGFSNLSQIAIPSSLTSIGNGAFSGCSKLTQITLPSSLTSINCNTFKNCSSLEQMVIPSSVTSIGREAFSECSNLKQINIPSSVTNIDAYAFSKCTSLTQITIPSSVTSIGNGAFSGCSKITQINIPSLTSINHHTFNNCSSLAHIEIPSSVTFIGSYAFFNCKSLTEIIFPPSVKSIGSYAFCECSNLKEVTIFDGGYSFGTPVFGGMKTLKVNGDCIMYNDRIFSEMIMRIKFTYI